MRQERQKEELRGTQVHQGKECVPLSPLLAASQPIPPHLVFIRAHTVQPGPSHLVLTCHQHQHHPLRPSPQGLLPWPPRHPVCFSSLSLGQKTSRQLIERSSAFLFYQNVSRKSTFLNIPKSCPGQALRALAKALLCFVCIACERALGHLSVIYPDARTEPEQNRREQSHIRGPYPSHSPYDSTASADNGKVYVLLGIMRGFEIPDARWNTTEEISSCQQSCQARVKVIPPRLS